MRWSVLISLEIVTIVLFEVRVTLGQNCKPWLFPGKTALPDDCSVYKECVNDKWKLMQCSSGNLFEASYQMCLPGQLVSCGSRQNPASRRKIQKAPTRLKDFFLGNWEVEASDMKDRSPRAPGSKTRVSWTTHYTIYPDGRKVATSLDVNYYQSDGESFTMTVPGSQIPDKNTLDNEMIEWVRSNKARFKTVAIPYEDDGSSQTAKPTPPPKRTTTTTYRTPTTRPTTPPRTVKPVKPEAPTAPPPLLVGSTDTLLPSNCGAGWRSSGPHDWKIIEGEVISIESSPWQVSLLSYSDRGHLCGGSIITKRHVITAAHCFFKTRGKTWLSRDDIIVRVGDNNKKVHDAYEKEINVFEIIRHQYYKQDHKRNDIALITLMETLVFSSEVFPICVPPVDPDRIIFHSSKTCMITGFGVTEHKTSSDVLLSANVSLISQENCRGAYPDSISKGMFCAGDLVNGGVDTCQGDSGGPLACQELGRFYLYGVTSWGNDCGVAGQPGVYTRVTTYREWIVAKLRWSSKNLEKSQEGEEDVDET